MGNDSGDPQPGFNHWESFQGQGQYYNPRINTNGEWVQYQDSTYVTDLLTEHAIDFIKAQQSANQSFMVYLCPALFQGGQTIEQMIQNIDIAPTLLACAGLDKPEQMVGASFLPLLRGENIPLRDKAGMTG